MTTLKYAYAGAGVKDDTSVSVQNLLIVFNTQTLNSHCFTVRLKVFGQSSRSHSHTLKSRCEKGIFDVKSSLTLYSPILFHDFP